MKKLRIAVIGAGHLGRIHTRLLNSMDEVQLVGVVDHVKESREKVAAEFQTKPFASHADVIDKIDAAIVAAPTQLHHRIGLDLLARGKHVLIEKPLALSTGECNDLVMASHAHKCVLQVGHVERFNPALTAVQDKLLHPKYIEATRASGYTFRSIDVGVVLDLMIHDIDIVLSLTGAEVTDVKAMGMNVFGPHEDLAHARLGFSNGCVANLKASRVNFHATRTMQVFAERSYAEIDFAAGKARLVTPAESILHREIDVFNVDDQQHDEIKNNLFETFLKQEDIQVEARNAILDEQYDFLLSIETGRQPTVAGEQGRDALAVADWILDEIAVHRWNGTHTGPIGPDATPSESLQRSRMQSPERPRQGIRRKAG